MTKIAIDVSSGEKEPSTYVLSGLEILKKHSDVTVTFVGNEKEIKDIIKNDNNSSIQDRFNIVNAEQKITMNDIPLQVIRSKRKSSMSIGLKLLKKNIVDAFVSSGNTGALLVFSTLILKTIEGISRPAIFKKLPTIKNSTHMLDLGANVVVKPENLLQFAVMGSVAVKNMYGYNNPTIGLLNIGHEESKGNEIIKQTANLLKESELNYVGFIEANNVYNGDVDIVVCDGYSGNIFLKASEGTANMISFFFREILTKNIWRQISSFFYIKELKAKLDTRKYNGASLLGLQGVVIKSHGGADKKSFINAIEVAKLEAHSNLSQKISIQVKNILQK